MSASLVGSEMCIRDRSAQSFVIGAPEVSFGGGSSQQRAGRLKCRAMAVSYTHLTLPTICSV
eukprot:3606399-Alexandrium_andersonii.AAC.1